MGMSGSPEVLAEIVLGVGGICYEKREDARPADLDRGNDDQDDASHQAGLWTHLSPFFSTSCEEAIPRSSTLFNVHEGCADAPWRGVCSCSTTSSLTCSRPTSSSSMLRRSILPRFTRSARIAKAPIAKAPIAVAPTAKAPRATAPIER